MSGGMAAAFPRIVLNSPGISILPGRHPREWWCTVCSKEKGGRWHIFRIKSKVSCGVYRCTGKAMIKQVW